METNQTVITVGQVLNARSAGDHNCIWRAEVVSRTAKQVTVKMAGYWEGEPKRFGVKLDSQGVEYIKALGSYSLAPCFQANCDPKMKSDWER